MKGIDVEENRLGTTETGGQWTVYHRIQMGDPLKRCQHSFRTVGFSM